MLDRMICGDVPRKHHIAFRNPQTGSLYFEECLTREGFDGPYTILYHQRRPHAQKAIHPNFGWRLPEAAPAKPLTKRHYKSQELKNNGGPALAARIPLLFNDDVTLSVLKPTESDPVYFANGDADDLFYIFRGRGQLCTPLGDLDFCEGDYVFVPRGLMHRMSPDVREPQHWLGIELNGGLKLLSQWRNAVGQLRMDAPYSHRDFKRPVFKGPQKDALASVVVKKNNAFHGYELEHSPLDVVGWDGTVYPWAFPILNFQPRVGLVHLPPTWHGTFSARGALICSFVPRVTDFHPEAVACPYPHSSVDCDEILFYCRGNFTSRKGVGPGSISHHPAGISHGPHPGAYEGSVGSKSTDELAVMIDTYLPLQATRAAFEIEDEQYEESFRG
jgi:homogentisate 1,2-dioxygenase